MIFQKQETYDFPVYHVYGKKCDQRRAAANLANSWMQLQHKRGARGALMLDIDDTLIDGRESVTNGFEHMLQLYRDVELLFPIHIVTARPDDQHLEVLRMLRNKGFAVQPDRLHMLPAHLWGQDTRHVEEFKWKTFLNIASLHGGVVARLGDKLWDVAHADALHGDMSNVHDKHCICFMDPRLKGTFSVKLPGV